MFSLLSKVIDYLVGDGHDTADSANQSIPRSKFGTGTMFSPSDLYDTAFFVQNEQNKKTKSFDGKVTHVFHGHGLIDGEVYFSMSDLHNDIKIQVGDVVHVKAVQHNEDGGWYAEDITVTEHMWDATTAQAEQEEIDLSVLQCAVVVGKVTSFNDGRGKIEKDISFEISDCKDGFFPMKGDWVAANVEEHEVEQIDDDEWNTQGPLKVRRARNICPSRQRNLEGVITGVMSDHGYIDGEIFFDRVACLNGYRPRKNDTVKVLAVESAQRKCEWRALSIVPLSSESDAYRSRQFCQPIKQAGGTWLVPGQRPKSFAPRVQLPVKLPHYSVPDLLEMTVLRGEELTDVTPHLMQELALHNYVRRMSVLLHLEEIQLQMDIREFDMTRVCLHPVREFLALTVPGLAEGRPSILVGDKIILSSPSDPDGPSYEGYVHELTCTDVLLKFTPEFHSRYNGEDYNIEFTFSRMPLRRCHQAVSLAVQYLGSKVLFPSQAEIKPPQVSLDVVMPTEDTIYETSSFSGSDFNNSHRSNTTSVTPRQQSFQRSGKETSQSSTSIYSSQDIRSKTHSPVISSSFSKSTESNGNASFDAGDTNTSRSKIPINRYGVSKTPSPVVSNSYSNDTGNSNTSFDKGDTITSHSKLQINRYGVSPGSKTSKGLKYFNTRLNERQKAAVMKILLGQARPTPYVIFGPPGTGKTITVVEAILQVFTQVPSSRILACTPSNSAADLITERLHLSGAIEQTQMVRLNAYQRSLDAIPECILKYCRFADDLPMISRYRVIVSTCTMAGALYGLGLSAGHITHVFVDECGQATEPECLIPVALLSGADGQIVLAGDPKQLGPIVMSPFARMYGLELSFLERLMLREPYQRDEELFEDQGGFDSALVTMLVNNYRSHPSILELPSRLFYYNELCPYADPELTHTLAKWTMLPTSEFPVIFHGIRGEDIREANSPSWFNPGETMQVVQYLQGVLKEGVSPEDVGIITPYRKQVEKIRLMMERLGMPDVKVGSVEEFQGQERQVIIISTVRANEKLVGFDIRHTLGFLSNPKRFNVAITRAQALLILVGNPHVLAQDSNWRTLIQYCADNGGYTGCDLPDLSAYDNQQDSELID